MTWEKDDKADALTSACRSPVSLYIHFPFCVRKCRYCDFVSGPGDEDGISRYLEALEREIAYCAHQNMNDLCGEVNLCANPLNAGAGWSRSRDADAGQIRVDTIFFGGGTPSLMSEEQVERLMQVIHQNYLVDPDAEITMECNPGTVDYDKLRAFRGAGINRLSVGVQSFRDDELRMLGRIHSAEQAVSCYKDARRAGFHNISLDLMSALPGQSYDQWMFSLENAVELGPEHISAYSLILEEGTPLRKDYENGKLPEVPNEDLDRRMYHDTKTFLAEHGYHRYEISNYAKSGFESRHNSGYWTEHPYLGFGLGAASYYIAEDGRRIRWNNTRNLSEYYTCLAQSMRVYTECPEEKESTAGNAENLRFPAITIRRNTEVLSVEDQMAEFMFLGLRRMNGVSVLRFEKRFGRSITDVYGDVIKRYLELGLLAWQGGTDDKPERLSLTDRGIDVSNTVMADFLL